MKTFLAFALMFAPTSVMAQVEDGAASVEALTRALNTGPSRVAVAPSPVAVPQVKTEKAVSAQPSSEAEALTRSLNQRRPVQGASPSAAPAVDRPVVANSPASEMPRQPVAPPTPAVAPAAVPAQAPAQVRQAVPAAAPAVPAAAVVRPQEARPVVSAPTMTPAPAPVRSERAGTAAAPVPGVLNVAAIAELPFQIDLPAGVQLASVSTARNARVWSVRRGPRVLAMIFAGTESQFPIFEGEQRTVAGRTSVVLDEGTRRVAVEHLFQRAEAPQELHIWLMVSEGPDRDLAERIAQTFDYR